MKNMFHKKFRCFYTVLIAALQATALSVLNADISNGGFKHENRASDGATSENPMLQASPNAMRISGFSDILVSESTSPASFTQRESSIAKLTDGRSIVCWTDDREGNRMTYLQIFNADGSRSGPNIRAVGKNENSDLIESKVVSDGSGGFYLGWRDVMSGQLMAARYDGELNRLNEFTVNNSADGSFAGPYDLALFPANKLAAVWENYKNGNSIALRIFSNSGAPLSGVIAVNDDGLSATHWVPSIAVEPSGNLAVTWEDYRNGNADIYMQFVNADGSLWGNNQNLIGFASRSSAQYAPEIAFSSSDGYIIGWLDRRSGTQRVLLQRITRAAGKIGGNVNISDNLSGTEDWDISMAVNSSGHLTVAWASVDTNDRILIQRFLSDVTPSGSIVTTSNYLTSSRWETSIGFDNSDKLYCLWSDFRRGNWDIFLKQYNSDNSPLSTEDILINDDARGAHSTEPAICFHDGIANYTTAFVDKRNDEGDIYYQSFLTDGQPFEDNKKLNADILRAAQNDPSIAANLGDNADGFWVVWVDNRAINGLIGQRIFLILRERESQAVCQEMIISDTNSLSPKSQPKIEMSSYFGLPMVAWIDYENGDGQVYARNMGPEGADGVKWGNIHITSNSDSEFDNTDIGLMVEDFDSWPDTSIFTIAWLSRGVENGPSVIFARHVSSTFESRGRFSFTSDQDGIKIINIATASNRNGDIYLLWLGKGATNHLYLTVLNKAGEIINPTFEITDDINADPEDIDIAADYNGIVATWVDSRNSRKEVFYQIFDPELNPYGANTPVSPTVQRYMMSPAIAMDRYNHNAVIAWVDPRADGLNVYMSQIDYIPTDIENDNPDQLPSGFALEQNFPNPFNPATSIRFSVPTRTEVSITVYNLLGQKIATIADKSFEAGTHTVNWNGYDLSDRPVASGIYFYRMEAGNFEFSRKMLLLK